MECFLRGRGLKLSNIISAARHPPQSGDNPCLTFLITLVTIAVTTGEDTLMSRYRKITFSPDSAFCE